jgi:hypothetical protein
MDKFVDYSAWQLTCPHMEIGYVSFISLHADSFAMYFVHRRKSVLMNAITFQAYKHFINPSRADPMYVRLHTPQGSNRGQLYVGNRLAMCLSVGSSTESYIKHVPEERRVRQKQLTILLHTQEGERYGAFACMVFNAHKAEMVAQVSDRGLVFSSMSQTAQLSKSPSKMLSSIKSPLAARFAAKTTSKGRSSLPLQTSRTALDFDEIGISISHCIMSATDQF